MPHTAVTMLSGQEAAKTNLALAVREAVLKELGIGTEYVCILVEGPDGAKGGGKAI